MKLLPSENRKPFLGKPIVKKGDVFGSLTVVSDTYAAVSVSFYGLPYGRPQQHVDCKCECGSLKSYRPCHLHRLHCGCKCPGAPRKGTLSDGEFKVCSFCLVKMPISNFDVMGHTVDKLASKCQGCRLSASRLQKYGITKEQYDEMMLAQDGKCGCCFKPFIKTPHIDHDHVTKLVRAIVCGPCNIAIGHAESARRALADAYLVRYGSGSKALAA